MAITLSKRIKSERINLITTDLVLVEIANHLAKEKFRNQCIIIIEELKKNTLVEKSTEDSKSFTWELYKDMHDKEWSYTDCFSFHTMKKYDLKNALTTDKHFEQARFSILLK